VDSTDTENGQITVNWIRPPEPEGVLPYTYELLRGEGFSPSPAAYVRVSTVVDDGSAPADFEYTFVDETLNTRNFPYTYKVRLTDTNGLLDSSATASSVRLSLAPRQGAIELNWQAQVPWNNQAPEYPVDSIFRASRPLGSTELPLKSEFVFYDTANVVQSGFRYIDNGKEDGPLDDATEYFYYVNTVGSYQNDEITVEPLLNSSQIASSFTSDSIPPCAPFAVTIANLISCEEYIQTVECGNERFENTITWEYSTDPECGFDVAYYEVYSSTDGINFNIIRTTESAAETSYTDILTSAQTFARYYYVVAVDGSGNRSERSQIIQRDNCPNYWLPNFVVANSQIGNEALRPPKGGDERFAGVVKNNIPERCPRFVDRVIISIYNRWGKEVYSYDSEGITTNSQGEPIPNPAGIFIEWNGQTNDGKTVSPGTYYYSLDIYYDVLDPDKQHETRNGWVDIHRTNGESQ
jgi:hypothetical protein